MYYKLQKMFDLDITNENNKKHHENIFSQITQAESFGSGKSNALLNLIKELNDIDKIYLCAKNLSGPKYEFLIKKCENAGKNI